MPATFVVKVAHELIINVIRCLVLSVDLGEPSRQLLLPDMPLVRGNRQMSSGDGIDVRRSSIEILGCAGFRGTCAEGELSGGFSPNEGAKCPESDAVERGVIELFPIA